MDCKGFRTTLIVSTYQKPKTNIAEFNIKSSACEKSLRFQIENKLKFHCLSPQLLKFPLYNWLFP